MVTLTVQGLSVALGARTVVRDVDADFAPGGLIGIIGPNGAGKSTFARALLGLVPYSGSITLDGAELATLPRAHLARRIAYLPQGQTLHWPLTVERLVALGRLPHLAPMSRIGEADRAIVADAMARADIAPLRDRIATELSGGERARALLARALAVQADALIADEPLAALDPGHQIDVMTLLRNQARAGTLGIVILHDLTLAARYCDRLLLMDGGTLVADGPPLKVLTETNLGRVYGIRARIEADAGWTTVVPLERI
jgi:iron complex transport system ATP-binding protein